MYLYQKKSLKNKSLKNHPEKQKTFKGLEKKYITDNNTTGTNKMNKQENDWSGYVDELDPY